MANILEYDSTQRATGIDSGVDFSPPIEYIEPHWYVVQTCAQHEKRVAERLERRGVQNFLPLYGVLSRRKDCGLRIQLPLFAGYVFVRIPLKDRLRVLETAGIARLVAFGGMPQALPDEQIETLRSGLSGHLRAEPHPFLNVGQRVRITHGSLTGITGILLRHKGNWRVVISIETICRSFVVDVEAGVVEPIAA